MNDYMAPKLDEAAIGAISAAGLAHVGDAVLELMVRTWLCQQGKATSGGLHRASVQYVNAAAQAAAMDKLLPELTEGGEPALPPRAQCPHPRRPQGR